MMAAKRGILGVMLLVSACAPEPETLTPQTLAGRSFKAAGPTILSTGSPLDTIASANYTIDFTSKDTATLHLFGQTVPMVRNASGNLVSTNRLFTLLQSNQLVGAPLTPDMVFLTLIDDFNSSGTAVTFSVAGNNTNPVSIPYRGTAGFQGSVVMFDGAANSSQGVIVLSVDYVTSSIGGAFAGGYPGNPLATFQLVPTRLSDGNFRTSLTSGDVAITGSGLQGSFYGTAADQIGGTVFVVSPAGNAAGFFSASN